MNSQEFRNSMFPFPIGTKVKVTTIAGGKDNPVECLFDGWGVYCERIQSPEDMFPVFKRTDHCGRPAIFPGYNDAPGKESRYCLPKWDDIVSVEEAL